jgi:ARG/rhodanese/phosphatase superfamily protein
MKHILTKTIIGISLAAASLNAGAAVGKISGPFGHKNLQVFLVYGESRLEELHYATLSEALTGGLVVVKETGNVQELTVENVSKDTTVFLNAGDILKGGRQDRTVRDDLILPPRSGAVPLASFCVEHGRWTKRGEENAAGFSLNNKVLSSRKLKMAARYGLNQGEVWAGVAEQQLKLNDNVSRLAGKNVDTRGAQSSSSLQLTLENQDLDSVRKQYFDKLERILDGKTDVIGFVYAINGEINSAEVYNNKNLFRALWPKLLDAAVTEAITECPKDGQSARAEAAQAKSLFETALSGSVKERTVWKTTLVKTYTTPTTVLFETLDLTAGRAWIHKSFINKEKETMTVPLDREER